ncbi:actin-crosslinking protein [Neocallimastix lanati (nom. inval.)]|uniref:Actin-crosslinking protein n=1 Tax=Neocallimastix californiae TaxID=1754190 RepID=A0A1Y2EUE8_9FUNG|nr:actin-crosslinking protein [Neocallimastix sp. JGI-2020a]ORY74475.1 actin-crosslinking protein [Neocallimastix californiae]|eukprot:ORY74475.1 actin-crosslinking protein [Neocallimastix californiae]
MTLEGWINVESTDDLVGPIFILSNATEKLSCICSDSKSSKISLNSVADFEDEKQISIKDVTPTDVSQVFVIKRVIDSSSFNLKSAYNKYLGCDKFGVVSCENEAVGVQEEWEVIFREDGIAFKNSYDKFLTVDEQDGKMVIRADSDTIGFHEIFTVKFQAQNRKKKKVKVEEKPLYSQEIDSVKKYQSWGNGRLVMPNQNLSDLRKAKKSGKMHEAMLDRREKLKSDSYCK